MNSVLRKAKALLDINYAYMLEYRAELLLWVLAGSLPLILMGVWNQAAQSGHFDLSPMQFTHYFIAVFIARQFTIVWVIWDFEREIVEGKLSPRLLQPLDPVWQHLAAHLAERLARLPMAMILVAGVFLLYPQSFWIPSLSDFGLSILAVIVSFSLRFIIQYTFALFAFWIEKASAIEQFWFLLYLFLSGLIAPLTVFPPVMQAILVWTPFPYMIHFPASLMAGLPVNVVQGFLVSLGWMIVFLGLNRWLWRQGLKQYSGMGA